MRFENVILYFLLEFNLQDTNQRKYCLLSWLELRVAMENICKLAVWLSVDLTEKATWLIVNFLSALWFSYAKTMMGNILRALIKWQLHFQLISVLMSFALTKIGNLPIFRFRSSVDVEWSTKREFRTEIPFLFKYLKPYVLETFLILKSFLCLTLSSKIITCLIYLHIWSNLCYIGKESFCRWDRLNFIHYYCGNEYKPDQPLLVVFEKVPAKYHHYNAKKFLTSFLELSK